MTYVNIREYYQKDDKFLPGKKVLWGYAIIWCGDSD